MFEKSFSLMRTNPALSGNVKLVVASDYKLYLESFRANKTLSIDRFSHFEIKDNEYYKEVVRYFFEGIEAQSVFEVKNDNDVADMHSDFQYQFDASYYAGAYYSEDTWYPEEYEYFAPLHMKKDKLPKSFVILRVDNSGLLNEAGSVKNFRKEIVDAWKFVKLFDLTENSTLGTWLTKNFVNDENMRDYPMMVNHEESRLSEIFGIDLNKGGWVTKYLNLEDTIAKNTPIFKTEEQFTQLWEDNAVLYPHLLNMKFLFDDTPATPTSLRKYSINRYVGFYVDEMQKVATVSPYKGFDLNKVDNSRIPSLSAVECSEIPYVKNNLFVREVQGTVYTFDPIKNGWVDSYVYWIEFNGTPYKVQRVKNYARSGVYGDWLYKIVSDKPIMHDVSLTGDDAFDAFEQRVLINELSTYANRIVIQAEVKVNEITAKNVINHAISTVTRLVKRYESIVVDGKEVLLFRLDGDTVTDNNLFTIPDYNEADLFLMHVGEDYFVVKKYDESIPGLGGMYYLQSDWAIEADESVFQYWINNGKQTGDATYLTRYVLAQPSNPDYEPLQCTIYKVQFSDIKDFDFDRVETSYARYEYEKDSELTPTLEPKMYAKEYRPIEVQVNSLQGDRVRRLPILDANGRKYNARAFNNDNNPVTGKPYTPEELYQRTFDGEWSLFDGEVDNETFLPANKTTLPVPRKYYREEHYILSLEDGNKEIDFKTHSLSPNIANDVTWGDKNIAEISDPKSELGALKGVDDPNEKLDLNYIPVSSEYAQSDELWEIRPNQQLSPIWNKNQSVCKWGIFNSLSNNDLPYRLNYSLDAGGLYNNVPNIYSTEKFPVRQNRDLDYFYRFGLKDAVTYSNYSLHLRDEYFDIDKYLSADYDYFSSVFKTDQLTSKGIKLTNKYSMFISDNQYEYPYTVFKGVKYQIQTVDRVMYDTEEYAANGRVIVDEVITNVNRKYVDYKFTIIFARKRSIFSNNSGSADNNFGIDVYVNERWKNVVIHIYIDTDEVIEMLDPVSNEYVNIETCLIDVLYSDNLKNEELNPDLWLQAEFRVNGLGINLRPRDLMLSNVLSILSNNNYEPVDRNKNKVNFIHVYENNDVKVMSRVTTDVVLAVELPSPFTILENAYDVKGIAPTVDFEINNTVKKRIIRGVNAYSLDGLRVDSLTDMNAYNDYPIAKTITDLTSDFNHYQLEPGMNPVAYRFSAAYAPLFKTVPLFKPQHSLTGVASSPGNWKFYDDTVEGQHLLGFGTVEEIIFSKCNTTSNVLKIQDETQKDKSIYPMVDEYGYDFDSRYIFSSGWEKDYYYTSRPIIIEPNEYPTLAGYTLSFNGLTEYLRIPDTAKFNLERYRIYNVNYQNYVMGKPWTSETSPYTTNTMLIKTGFGATYPTLVKEFGGYLKTVQETDDILTHPVKVTNTSSFNELAGKLNTALQSRSYTVAVNNDDLVVTNPTNFEFEPEYYTNIANGSRVVYYGTPMGTSGPLTAAYADLKIYLSFAEPIVEFVVKPSYGDAVPVSINTLDTARVRISAVNFTSLVGQRLPLYNVTLVSNDDDSLILHIESKQPGYYYNFNVASTQTAVEVLSLNPAALQRKFFDVFNKTELKPVEERMTGYLNDLTVEFWISFSNVTKRFETVLYKGKATDADVWKDGKFTDFSYIIGQNEKSNQIAFKTCHKKLNGSKSIHTLISRTALTPDTWYHVACVSSSDTQSKQIYINGELDITIKNFLGPVKTLPADRELVYQFLNNRQRFLPGPVFNRIGSETALADRIRNNVTDQAATRWFDLIRSYRAVTLEDQPDLEWQRQNWKATLSEAYDAFKAAYNCYDYYINTSKDLTWDILVGTDAVVRLGSRCFSGSLDELRFWSCARTAQQIRLNYRFSSRVETHLDPLSTLVAYYRFDEGVGANQITDLMGGHMVKKQTRWYHLRNEQINDGEGGGVKHLEEQRDYVFETEFFDGAHINVALSGMKWTLSGADIVGYSDERYALDVPPPRVLQITPVPVVVKTKKLLLSNQLFAAQADALPVSDTKVSLIKPAAETPLATAIRLPKPVANDFAADAVSVITENGVPIYIKPPVKAGAVVVKETLPEVDRTYTTESGVVSTATVVESDADATESSNPISRAETRISSVGDDRSSNILRQLWSLITKRKDQ